MGRAGVSRAAMMKTMGHAEERDVRAAVEALGLSKVKSDRPSGTFEAIAAHAEAISIQ
jgi:hypothetical protein